MFMPSPAKKSSKSLLAESGETRTSAKKHIRPPAPSIVDEDEDEGRTQIRPMPKGGKLSLPTSSVSVAKIREREPASEPPPARKDVRVPEISLPKSSAVMSELDMDSMASAADAPDFTMQLGPSMGAGKSSPPPPMKSSPPPAMPQMSTHQFAPVTSAPVRSQPPAMAATAMMGQPMSNMGPSSGMMAPGPMQMAPMGAPMSPAMMSGQVQAMSPAMMSGQLPAMSMSHQQQMAGMSGGFPQQHANMSGGYAAASGQFPGAPLSDPRLDPPGTAMSLSRAAPKPARVWVMAFAAVSAAAAIAVFGLTKGSPGAQKATAAFVDPSQAPGEPAPGAAPLGTTAPSAPQAAAPAVAQGAPAPGLTPADLLAQPAVSASAANMAPATGAALVAAPAAPAVAAAPPGAAAVAVAPPGVVAAVSPPAAKPAAPAAAPTKPEVPKVVKVAPAEPKVAATPKPPKPATPKPEEGPKKTASPADKEMKDAADALARAQLEQSL